MMNFPLKGLALFAAIFASSALSSPALDRDLEQALRDWHTPGMSVAVVREDKVALTAGYGVRKQGEAAKVDEHTLFALGSTSKAFAAATVAVLVSDRSLAWDDRVRMFLPWLELTNEHVSEEITVRDLLVHRYGTSYKDENRLRAYSSSARDLLERGRYLTPVAPFRSRYVYSNNMFVASGLVVATVSGMPWPEFARKRLWEPLGMTATGADAVTARSTPNAASPHVGPAGRDPEPMIWTYKDVGTPSGGVNSNATDMARWLRFQLGEGVIDGRTLIERQVFREMHRPQTAISEPAAAPDIQSQFPDAVRAAAGMRFWAYGMGWYVTEYRGRTLIYHSGTIDGFRAGVGLLPEEKLAVCVLANRTSLLPMVAMLRTFDEFLDGPRRDWNAMYLRSQKE